MSVWHREDVSLVALITGPRNIASFVESDSLQRFSYVCGNVFCFFTRMTSTRDCARVRSLPSVRLD